MATKKESKKPSTTASKTVTRIKATDTKVAAKKETAAKKTEVKKKVTPKKASKGSANETSGYFKGAWQELRQVRWPNRRATWSLTAAMLLFTAFFVVLILLLDALFKYIFQLILG